MEGDPSSMHPCLCHAAETLKGCGQRGRRQAPPRLQPVGSPCGDGKSSLETLSILQRAAFPIQVVRGRLAGPISCWENIGARPSPSARVEEKSGPLSVGMSLISASMWQGPMNSKETTPFTGSSMPQELQHALRLAGGDLEKASALLWSIKEAVVKALGCAFHLVDPRQITVYPSAGGEGEDGGYTVSGGLVREALARFPIAAGRSLWVRSLPQGKMWLSIALLNGQLDEAMGGPKFTV
jgi:hypothetical protein